MASGEHRRIAFGAKHDCCEGAEPSVAEHRDSVVAAQSGLLEDLIDRGDGLDKDGELVGNRIG